MNVGLYEDGVGLTTVGHSLKERNSSATRACTVTIHHGPYWITVEGKARLHTWDDTDPETMRRLLREIYVAAGVTTTTGRPMTRSCAKNAALQW